MDKLNIGIISFAHLHAYSYFEALTKRQDVNIVGIADEVSERVEKIVKLHGIPYFKDWRGTLTLSLFARKTLDMQKSPSLQLKRKSMCSVKSHWVFQNRKWRA